MKVKPLTRRQTDVFRVYEREGKAGNWPTLSSVARELEISKPTTVELISRMVDKGYLIRVGEGRAVRYRVPSLCPTCGAEGSSPERIEAIRREIAVRLHTALRKDVDGPEAATAWQAINRMSNSDWAAVTRAAAVGAFELFIEGAKESLNGGKT